MSRLDRWQQRTELPLVGAALAFLVAYAVPIAAPDAPDAVQRTAQAVVGVTWAAFWVDYAVRLALAPDRRAFARRNLVDLAVLVLPLLRPLRLLRVLAVLSVLNRAGVHGLRGRVVLYVTVGTALLLTAAALAVTDAERAAVGSPIQNLGDGFWWAVTTMTTVGYGDTYPVTTTGRAVAVALMLAGIALLGTVTATLASWLVDRVAEEGEAEQTATRAQVAELAREVAELRKALAHEPAPVHDDAPPSGAEERGVGRR
ncbi:two pore domain potassium channel family protein [Cellulomonas sp. APG4]|uniref:potassium channel family protein n=1 Tax=Cellulomonas sp. APG4 TaxID=1538656 RepID=UPI0013798840|nr:potassium channel family protein [Cellulomonas sp. APG4]NCT89634.1 two pore domain potassium channel family protein [Cellulomonas sp. APG4]